MRKRKYKAPTKGRRVHQTREPGRLGAKRQQKSKTKTEQKPEQPRGEAPRRQENRDAQPKVPNNPPVMAMDGEQAEGGGPWNHH